MNKSDEIHSIVQSGFPDDAPMVTTDQVSALAPEIRSKSLFEFEITMFELKEPGKIVCVMERQSHHVVRAALLHERRQRKGGRGASLTWPLVGDCVPSVLFDTLWGLRPGRPRVWGGAFDLETRSNEMEQQAGGTATARCRRPCTQGIFSDHKYKDMRSEATPPTKRPRNLSLHRAPAPAPRPCRGIAGKRGDSRAQDSFARPRDAGLASRRRSDACFARKRARGNVRHKPGSPGAHAGPPGPVCPEFKLAGKYRDSDAQGGVPLGPPRHPGPARRSSAEHRAGGANTLVSVAERCPKGGLRRSSL